MKTKKIKLSIIIVLLVLAIAGPFIYSFFKYYNDYDFTIVEYEIDAVIDENGDMKVIEKFTNRYDELNDYIYKEIIYGNNNYESDGNSKSRLVHDVKFKVLEGNEVVFDSTKDKNTRNRLVGFSYNNDRDERGDLIRCDVPNCEMIFYYDRSDFNKLTTFYYEYTIEGVVTEYNDISDFNWVMLASQDMNVENLKINITLPEGDYDIKDQKTYFFGTNSAKREFVDNNKITITSNKLVSGEHVEVRLLVDKDVFSSVREINKVGKDAFETIVLAQEEIIKFFDLIYNVGFYGSIGLYVLGVVFLAFLTYRCYNKYDKEYVSDFYNDYYRELPAEYAPAVMGYLYKFKELDDNDLTATLLDLIRRKYLILVNNSVSVNEDNPDYIIKLNKDKSRDDLTDQEKHLIKWFIEDIGNGEEVHSQDLSDYCDSYTNAQRYQDNNSKWVKLVEKDAKKYDFFDEDVKKGKRRYKGLGLFLIFNFIGLSILHIISQLDICFMLIISLAFIFFAYYVYMGLFDRRSKAGNEDFVRWRAFKKFLEEFSSFEDYPVPSLIIWEHYLVYATSFGIADKVTSQLKLKFKLDEINSVDTTFILYYGLRYNYVRNLNRSIYSARVSARDTITKYNASRSGSGRIGGGFSGGSSFGGGGGRISGGRR